MADTDVVKTITIKGATQGVDEATASVNKLGDAMADVSVVSDTTSKSTTSVQNALDKQQRSLDSTYRAQIQYNASQRVITEGLNQGLVSQDRANQLLDLAKTRFEKASGSVSPFASALQGVQLQLVALSAGLGPVGVFLAGLGPIGLVAAGGIGAAIAVFDKLSDAAQRLGDKSIALRSFSLSTQFSAADIQKLTEAASQFGIETDSVKGFLEQFEARLTDTRNLTGPYYDLLVKINPALALQAATTKDNAAELTILAAAYQQAGDKATALLKAAGGRGALSAGPLIGAIGAAGSVSGLPANASALTSDYINQLAQLKAASDTAGEHIRDNLASVFSGFFLTNMVKSRQEMESLTNTLKNFSPSSAWTTFTDWVDKHTGGFLSGLLGTGTTTLSAPVVPVQPGGALPSATATQLSPEQQAAQAKQLVSSLGEMATASERADAKLKALKVSTDYLTLSETDQRRAVAAINLEFSSKALDARVATLGIMAPLSDLNAQAQNRINAVNREGAGITTAQTQAIQANIAATKLAADTQILVANNVVTAEGLRVSKLAELNAALLQGKLTQDQVTVSAQAYEKVIEQTIQQQNAARAALTNLANLQNQAGSLRNQLDTFSTDTTNNIGTAFVDIATGAKTAKDAFANLEQQVIKSLLNMVVQMSIVAPIAKSLQAILGGFLPGGTGAGGGEAIPLPRPNPAALGNVYDAGRIMLHPFALGGILSDIVTKPTIFPMASGAGLMGEAGPEAVMPLTRGSNGKLGVHSSGGGNIVVQHTTKIINTVSNDTNVSTQQGPDPQTMIVTVTRKAMAQGLFDAPFKGRYGVHPNKVRAG